MQYFEFCFHKRHLSRYKLVLPLFYFITNKWSPGVKFALTKLSGINVISPLNPLAADGAM
jgi:hypothetical protein